MLCVSEEGKNQLIEKHFEIKFNTTYSKNDISSENISTDTVGVPDITLSDQTAEDMMRLITMKELDENIAGLLLGKAEGLDGITNEMLKNTGPVARGLLLELFNNVIMGAQLPSEWKEGDIILILKKPPRTDIGNYRPITLISCVSKLLTKILAKRVSATLDEEDFVGAEQNGFRTSRSCGDNIFILNTILEFNKSKKLQSHLLFVDLKEAYDRVDRNVLLLKLEQLNFPTTFLKYLRNYYFLDSISSASAGIRTRPQYQKRGLRQGCNLSAVLFIIYLSELSRRMKRSGLGVRLPSGELVNILLFADDIIILADNPEDLLSMKSILEQWCRDFRMKISAAKTSVITPDTDLECLITDLISGEVDVIEHVSHYKYLGILQFSTPKRTSKSKSDLMITRAKQFKSTILRTSMPYVDRIAACSSIWINVALPSILYGTEVIPVAESTISELESIQNSLGKSILGLPVSTANPVINIELGWKPIGLHIAKSKLGYFKRVSDSSFKGSPLVKSCMIWNVASQTSLYMKNLNESLEIFFPTGGSIESLTVKAVHEHYEAVISAQVQLLPSLRLLPIPRKWWKPAPHLFGARWRTVITRFKVMNAGLGNRDAYRAADAVADSGGRVKICPLCLNGDNNEVHLLIQCKRLNYCRTKILVHGGVSLDRVLAELRISSSDDAECVRRFLGQSSHTCKELMERGLALDILLDEFFLEWSKASGKTFKKNPGFNYV